MQGNETGGSASVKLDEISRKLSLEFERTWRKIERSFLAEIFFGLSVLFLFSIYPVVLNFLTTEVTVL